MVASGRRRSRLRPRDPEHLGYRLRDLLPRCRCDGLRGEPRDLPRSSLDGSRHWSGRTLSPITRRPVTASPRGGYWTRRLSSRATWTGSTRIWRQGRPGPGGPAWRGRRLRDPARRYAAGHQPGRARGRERHRLRCGPRREAGVHRRPDRSLLLRGPGRL